MASIRKNKRQRLVEAADRLVQRHGFNRTTLADLAKTSRVALGNIHYYFRTKDALGEALIEDRAEKYRTLRDRWGKLPEPKDRLIAFIQMIADKGDMLARNGCPIGSLCQELSKEGGKLANRASNMFTELLSWLEAQFQELGQGKRSAGLSIHLISAIEGAALLTHTFQTPSYIVNETDRMKEWIRSL
jgi:AcrR family transcriptional regulator